MGNFVKCEGKRVQIKLVRGKHVFFSAEVKDHTENFENTDLTPESDNIECY